MDKSCCLSFAHNHQMAQKKHPTYYDDANRMPDELGEETTLWSGAGIFRPVPLG